MSTRSKYVLLHVNLDVLFLDTTEDATYHFFREVVTPLGALAIVTSAMTGVLGWTERDRIVIYTRVFS